MNNEYIKDVVALVATHLYGFKAVENYLMHDCGYKLLFYNGWNKSEIIGQNCTYPHHIGCSFKKEPYKIAADIKRRLLPQYKEDFIKTKRDKLEAKERKSQDLLMLEALAHESKGELREDYNGWRRGDYELFINPENLTIRKNDHVFKITLTLDFGKCLKLIRFLETID